MVVQGVRGGRRLSRARQTLPGRARSSGRGRSLDRLQPTVAFLAAAVLVSLYAFSGGAYDAIVFERFGIIIWFTVAAGVAVGLLPRVRPARPVIALWTLMALYIAWTALSLTWTVSAERTLLEVARSVDYLGLLVLIGSSLDRDGWRAALTGLGFGALLVCVVAVIGRLLPGTVAVGEGIVGADASRLSYPFGYWNAVGAWASMAVALALAVGAHDRRALHRAVALGLVPWAAAAEYLSYSRGGLLGMTVGVIVVLILSRHRITALASAVAVAVGASGVVLSLRAHPAIADATSTAGGQSVLILLLTASLVAAAAALILHRLGSDRWRLPRRLTRGLGAILLIALLAAAAGFGPRLAVRGWHAFTHPVAVAPASPSSRLLSLNGTRYDVWKAAIAAFDRHPLTGTGAGTFQFWWEQHATTYEFDRDAHSIWLQNLAELGAPGCLLIIGVFIGGLAVVVRARSKTRRGASAGLAAGAAAAFVVFLTQASIDWMWESTAVTVLALAAVAVLGVRLGRPRGQPRLPWRLAGVLIALLAVAVQLPGWLSSIDVRHSQAAERAGNGAAALAWADDAVAIAPWAASNYEQRALVEEAAGRLGAAAADEQRAAAHEPTNVTHWLILARINTERGHLAAAVSEDARAHRLRPLGTVFLVGPYLRR